MLWTRAKTLGNLVSYFILDLRVIVVIVNCMTNIFIVIATVSSRFFVLFFVCRKDIGIYYQGFFHIAVYDLIVNV